MTGPWAQDGDQTANPAQGLSPCVRLGPGLSRDFQLPVSQFKSGAQYTVTMLRDALLVTGCALGQPEISGVLSVSSNQEHSYTVTMSRDRALVTVWPWGPAPSRSVQVRRLVHNDDAQ